ncbi:DUF853 domain-containing protein [Candidatus Binatia bacterium]|nr:DUF853 domain-containing protein [Candidatus Binatia bacterium]
MTSPLPIARVGDREICLLPQFANRHGLIAGATGTGKTVTLQVLVERLSAAGVPVFLADVKGDLSGLAAAGSLTTKLRDRLEALHIPEPRWTGFPVEFWDVFGSQGLPVRATVTEMGPLLLARVLDLNATQQAVLTVAFKVADDHRLPLLDLKDLRAMVQFVGDRAAQLKTRYGNIAPASVGAIQRGLVELEEQDAEAFFGEPAFDVGDLLRVDNGRGVINILAADRLLHTPRLYSAFLLFLLAELFEELPEVGDPERPKLVFFFDEAHLLFTDAPKALLERVEQVVRLIRSKGVGVYFVTQSPLDLPETVLGQLGNRLQHALRAFTPKDQSAVRTAARTMRQNPGFDVVTAITELAVGEALVSCLDAAGVPSPVERANVLPPASRIGPIEPAERRARIEASPLAATYERPVDRESAYEILERRTAAPPGLPEGGGETRTPVPESEGGMMDQLKDLLWGSTGPRGGRREGVIQVAAKSLARSAGREILRGVLGTLGGQRRRR